MPKDTSAITPNCAFSCQPDIFIILVSSHWIQNQISLSLYTYFKHKTQQLLSLHLFHFLFITCIKTYISLSLCLYLFNKSPFCLFCKQTNKHSNNICSTFQHLIQISTTFVQHCIIWSKFQQHLFNISSFDSNFNNICSTFQHFVNICSTF